MNAVKWCIFWLSVSYGFFASTNALSNVSSMEQTQTLLQQGQFEQAISDWQEMLQNKNLTSIEQFDILVQLANAHQTLGLSQKASTFLLQAEKLITDLETTDKLPIDLTRLAILLSSLSDLFLVMHREPQARHYIDRSMAILPADAPPLMRAAVLNNLGNVFAVEAYYSKSLAAYIECATLAEGAGDKVLAVRALINAAQVYFKNNQPQAAANALYPAWKHLKSSSNNDYAKAFALLGIGELAQRIQRQLPFPVYPRVDESNHIFKEDDQFPRGNLYAISHFTLQAALKLAEKLKNSRLTSYASGYLGQLYEIERRYPESLRLTRQAIFFAQQAQALEVLFRWQWQLGRLFKAQKQFEPALTAYQQAIENLKPIRQELALGYRDVVSSFRNTISPLYFELADLLLQQATQQPENQKRWLQEARNTIEQLKTAELEDHFQEDCLLPQPEINLADLMIPNTAILYLILLPDRTEILLTLPQGIERFTVPINSERLRDEVNEFRFELEARESDAFMPYAQRLYDWLIAPLEPSLKDQKIDTLIIVPDGVLRTIPFAALHDGKQFLITRYALATTPSLTLTDPNPSNWNQAKILISGLSRNIQGYAELSQVRQEVQLLNNLYNHSATVLLDKDFTVNKLTETLNNQIYSMIHIASHGLFNSDFQKTFILTYEDKLTVSQLEQLIRLSKVRKQPIELLTLSACETAVGDDQAALGLAGIGLKAGARSALATLWSVDDEATTQLIGEFYDQLQNKKATKAVALQRAQKKLLNQSRYQHPSLWSSFLLIGNWL